MKTIKYKYHNWDLVLDITSEAYNAWGPKDFDSILVNPFVKNRVINQVEENLLGLIVFDMGEGLIIPVDMKAHACIFMDLNHRVEKDSLVFFVHCVIKGILDTYKRESEEKERLWQAVRELKGKRKIIVTSKSRRRSETKLINRLRHGK